LLPIDASEYEEVAAVQRQLEAVRRIVAIGPAAAELGQQIQAEDGVGDAVGYVLEQVAGAAHDPAQPGTEREGSPRRTSPS